MHFNYETESWEPRTYDLPCFRGDYVPLTPRDLLTKDDTWINKADLIHDFRSIPEAIPNVQLRAQINNYFRQALPKKPTRTDEQEAKRRTLLRFPELIDYFVKYKEDHGQEAESVASSKVAQSRTLYLHQFRQLSQLLQTESGFYTTRGVTYDEAYQRVQFFKDVIENKGGHRIFY